MAGPWYWAPFTGSDSNDGLSPSTPKRTIPAYSAGETVYGKRGEEARVSSFLNVGGAVAGATQTKFGAYGAAQIPYFKLTLPQGGSAPAFNWGSGASTVRGPIVEDWWIRNEHSSGRAVQAGANASNARDFIMRRCLIEAPNSQGECVAFQSQTPQTYRNTGFVLEACEIRNGGGHGVLILDSDGCRILGNDVYNTGYLTGAHGVSTYMRRTTITSANFGAPTGNVYPHTPSPTPPVGVFVVYNSTDGVLLANAGATSSPGVNQFGYTGGVLYVNIGGVLTGKSFTFAWVYCGGNIIARNRVHDIRWYVPYAFHEGHGIALDDFASDDFVYGNEVYDCEGLGISVNRGSNNLLAGNKLRENWMSGIVLRGPGHKVYNNTLRRNLLNPAGVFSEISAEQAGSTSYDLRNNLIIARDIDTAIAFSGGTVGSATLLDNWVQGAANIHTAGASSSLRNQLVADIEQYLSGDLAMRSTVEIGGVPMRNPLDGAGIFVQGARTFDGRLLDPGRVPIGACRPMMRMR